MASRWEHQNFDVWAGGNTYRNVLTITRPETAGYEVTGHSAILRARRSGEDQELEVALLPLGTPTLSSVEGVPHTLTARFAFVLAPSQVASLESGAFYNYAVFLLDSRGETQPEAKGAFYVGSAF